ncbi:LytR/AlgR family response regulator transcription factor [Dyadobacter psychrotolerans]|uniref:Response regulator n=1 Tax=Dyadobacter psychrotolerans TaxID=2541721 RepID=A0A4R5D973_9BACT|nr:response regulator transcription factor [Dyadobacter psychrotolerans]TDE08291.1 response regulator [Dyadobacter psychrotolerans]
MSQLKHILIVEDDYLQGISMTQNLTSEGFSISGIARNIQEAVKIISSKPVDLALIDMVLDGPEDGVITAKELMKIKWVPIIYITGSSPFQAKDRLKETFPAAFFQKPLRYKELAVQIELALNNFEAGAYPSSDKFKTDHIYLPSGKRLISIKLDEILYIEADKRESYVFLSKNEIARMAEGAAQSPLTVSVGIGRISPKLPAQFFRVSRSLVINLNHIHKIEGHTIHLQSHVISIPEARTKRLMHQLTILRK